MNIYKILSFLLVTLFTYLNNHGMAHNQVITIVSYNVLAPSYVNPNWYKHVDSKFLDWTFRKAALLEKIKNFNADILCLQEIEQELFHDLGILLTKEGYKGIYAQKGLGKPDGCATFFKEHVLDYKDAKTIYYQDNFDDSGNISASGHIALLVYLSYKGKILGIANTHIRWDEPHKKDAEHIGYRQVKELLDDHLCDVDYWIVCGDFNAEKDSPVIQLMKQYGFKDAYEESSLEQATVNIGGPKRIDYIFHTPNLHLYVQSITVLDENSALPSADEPSDHLAISACLKI